jgi:hypothetical protein
MIRVWVPSTPTVLILDAQHREIYLGISLMIYCNLIEIVTDIF